MTASRVLVPVAAVALALALGASPAAGDSFVRLDRRVPDAVFHRAVACAAPPGRDCTEPLVAWPAPDRRALTVALRSTEAKRPGPRQAQVGQALDQAIAEINGVGADLRLVRVADGSRAAISVWDSRLREGDPIVLPAEGLDGTAVMEGARVEVWWDGRRRITRAVIVIAGDLPATDLRSVVLEEVVQALGLLTDITGRAYAETSVFSEDANTVTRLSGQDAAVIRMHYPRE